MTEQVWGADVEQLDALARDLKAAAGSLESIARSLAGRISGTAWSGRDASSFRADWQGQHASALRSAGAAMHTAATQIARTRPSSGTPVRHRVAASGTHRPPRAGSCTTCGAVPGGSVTRPETVQMMADAAAAGAGAAAVAGVFMPPGFDVVDIVGASAFAPPRPTSPRCPVWSASSGTGSRIRPARSWPSRSAWR